MVPDWSNRKAVSPLLRDRWLESQWCHIHPWPGVRGAKLPSLIGKDGVFSPVSISVTVTNREHLWASCTEKRVVCVALQCDTAWGKMQRLASHVSEEAYVSLRHPSLVVIMWQRRASWWVRIGRWPNWRRKWGWGRKVGFPKVILDTSWQFPTFTHRSCTFPSPVRFTMSKQWR